jgi:beta-fructofuranosidase
MLITARANTGDADNRGVIGHATSTDLDTWTVQPPLSASGAGFGQLEVPQLATIDHRPVLIFSCLTNEMSSARRIDGGGGVWAVTIDDPNAPLPIDRAVRLTDESLYAGRLIQHRSGQWFLFAFHHVDADGEFVGALSDPIPVSWGSDGDLRVTDGRFDHLRTNAPAAQPSSN